MAARVSYCVARFFSFDQPKDKSSLTLRFRNLAVYLILSRFLRSVRLAPHLARRVISVS